MLNEAHAYRKRGWSIIPMRMETKLPAVKWTPFQSALAEDRYINGWFKPGSTFGIGVIFGAVSRDLASRDFDALPAYDRWAKEHPELARSLPTVITARGRHVYFRAAPASVQNVRRLLGKPDGTGAIKAEAGELRAGIGCYSVLPPSVHPEGHVYRWLVPLPAGDLPIVDALKAGLISASPSLAIETESTREDRDDGALQRRQKTTKTTKTTEAMKNNGSLRNDDRTQEAAYLKAVEATGFNGFPADIQAAILGAIPESTGHRHEQVFFLARSLKAVPSVQDAEVTELKPYALAWHRIGVALQVVGTVPFDETWIDFLRAWPRVKFPLGAEPMEMIVAKAKACALPVIAGRFDSEEARLLTAICRQLQLSAGDKPFYLDCRTAGRILGVVHATAWRYLHLLEHERVLDPVERGKRGEFGRGKATRYRYLGD